MTVGTNFPGLDWIGGLGRSPTATPIDWVLAEAVPVQFLDFRHEEGMKARNLDTRGTKA
jgi:hypothetical protein